MSDALDGLRRAVAEALANYQPPRPVQFVNNDMDPEFAQLVAHEINAMAGQLAERAAVPPFDRTIAALVGAAAVGVTIAAIADPAQRRAALRAAVRRLVDSHRQLTRRDP